MTAKIKSHSEYAKTSHKHKPKGVSDSKFEKVYWPYLPIILLAGFLLTFTTKNHILASVIRHPAGKVLGYAVGMSEDDLLSKTNSQRQSNNLAPLKLNNYLVQAAQAKANDMAKRDYWSHTTPQGYQPWVFVDAVGYRYQKLGENLATGFSDPSTTIQGWMASTEHRKNMLDSAYSEAGFGYANIPNYAAAGGGPMTIVVAFYGSPIGVSDAANSKVVGAGSISNTTPTDKTVVTSRAQLAFASSPIAGQAKWVAVYGMILIAGIWIGRHLIGLRRVVVQGESFVIAHPLFDVGLILIGVGLFALTRTAGLIL
jgi:uncharacterized protein YkwD